MSQPAPKHATVTAAHHVLLEQDLGLLGVTQGIDVELVALRACTTTKPTRAKEENARNMALQWMWPKEVSRAETQASLKKRD
jgi:hypothetical protein